ncbi:MAG TPA: hypothetical protein VGI70_22150 [Polyangiales bacterium]|jgi:hypothetical protein
MKNFLSIAALVAASACVSTGGKNSLIGETCQTADDCDVSGVCVTDGKDGLCALPCLEPGGAGQCPLGAYCDRASLTTDSQPMAEMTLCLPACKSNSDCRDGYECNDVSSGPGKVCEPK